MATENVVFASVMEALLPPDVRQKLSPEAKKRIRDIGVDLDKPFDPAYPGSVWADVVKMLGPERYPKLSEHDAQLQLGQDFMNRYAGTLVASALFALLRVIGPRRAMHRLARNFKSGGSDIDVVVKELTPTQFEVRFERILVPASHYLGMMLAASRLSGAVDVRGKMLSSDASTCTLDIRWGPRAPDEGAMAS